MAPRPREEFLVNGLDARGFGIADGRHGKTRVVGALPGDRVRARMVSRPGNPPRAVVEERLEDSEHRVDVPCPVVESCGACSWMALDPELEVAWKARVVEEALAEHPSTQGIEVGAVHGAENRWAYRNRAILPVDRFRGRVRVGYYRARSHEVVDVAGCPVLLSSIESCIAPIRQCLRGADVYDERSRQGLIRRVGIRAGERTEDVLVTVVVTDPKKAAGVAKRFAAGLPESVGIAVNIQRDEGNAVYGAETTVFRGPGWIREEIAGREVRLAPRTFFQLNTSMAERLYGRVIELAAPEGRCADLFGGIGIIGGGLLDAGADQVTVVESVQDSCDEARRLFAEQPGMKVVQGSVADVLPGLGDLDVIVTDPPRKGLDPATLAALLALPPRRLVHVACSARSLVRDLARLLEGPYRLAAPLEVFDMLPQTPHVEVVALLERKPVA